jgi:hypothetical protein
MIAYDTALPASAAGLDWLETNGRGACASGPVSGSFLRPSHAFLSVPTGDPAGPLPLLKSLEESAPGGSAPLAQEFRLDPFPVWILESAGARLKRSVFMRYGEDTVVVLYEHVSGPALALEARPLLPAGDGGFFRTKDGFRAEGGSRPPFRVEASCGEYREEPVRRGDLFQPGAFRLPLAPGGWAAVVASRADVDPREAPAWAAQERRLREDLLSRSPLKGDLGRALTLAADQFLLTKDDEVKVAAGYPGALPFERDAVASIPGLCLATGRADDAEKALDLWAEEAPSFLFTGDAVAPEGLEAGLWGVWAAQKFFKATRDLKPLARWAPALRRLVDAVEKGDRRGVHMDRDGLVFLPPGGAARAGKPVEVQALWYMDLKLKEKPRGYDKLAAIARASFNEKFWNEREEYPFDRLDGREKDPAVRPRALLSVGLPYEILGAARFAAVVDRAEREFLSPRGLLAEDGREHPWLLGPFLTAFAKARGSSAETKALQAEVLRRFRDAPRGGAAGSAAEWYEASPPHAAGGRPASARAVAEILRILSEENIPL